MNWILNTVDAVSDLFGLNVVRLPLSQATQNGDVTLAIPGYFQAKSYNCGFAAGLCVLHTFFPRRSPQRFLARCAPNTDDGVSIPRLVRALRTSGVAVLHRHDLNFREITKCIDAGRPIITDVDSRDGQSGALGRHLRLWKEAELRFCPGAAAVFVESHRLVRIQPGMVGSRLRARLLGTRCERRCRIGDPQ